MFRPLISAIIGRATIKQNGNNDVVASTLQLKYKLENCALLAYYTASSGNFLPTFQNNLSVPSSSVNKQKMGQTGCPETSVSNYHRSQRNNPEDGSSHRLRGGSLKSRKIQVYSFVIILNNLLIKRISIEYSKCCGVLVMTAVITGRNMW